MVLENLKFCQRTQLICLFALSHRDWGILPLFLRVVMAGMALFASGAATAVQRGNTFLKF
jgi:hypothetical protein